MKSTLIHPASPLPTAALTAAMQKAFSLLLEARDYAQELRKNDWEFAVELPALLDAGCTRSALRWLVAKGYLEHAIERTPLRATARSFRRMANLAFAAPTCFLLTPSGISVARQLGHAPGAAAQPQINSVLVAQSEGNGYLLPHWDADLRELRCGISLIKAFRQPALNQMTILAAFEEEGWPRRIYNPLSPRLGQDGKQRLHDAINRLNRHHLHRLIHFRSDNNGEGIRWETVHEAPPERP
jgi:hypothetical protein